MQSPKSSKSTTLLGSARAIVQDGYYEAVRIADLEKAERLAKLGLTKKSFLDLLDNRIYYLATRRLRSNGMVELSHFILGYHVFKY